MEKTVFEGKDITQWLQHFRLQSSKLSEVLQEMEVVDVSDLEHVYGNEEQLDQIRQRIEVIVVAVQAYTKILQQIKEERRRRAFDAQQRRRTLQQAISVDLAFLVDCTGSMGHFITAIRNNVVAFVKSIHKRYPTTMLRIAFVGYRDFCDEDHMVIHPFTANAEDIRNYLFTQRAMGGGDEAEDVLGGLEVANNNLDWLAETRILYHIGDAPGHGEEFHDSKVTDDHSKQFGLDDYRRVLHSLYDKKVKYFFGKIKDTTDIMISKFNELIGSKYILETPLRPTEMMNEIRRRTIWTTRLRSVKNGQDWRSPSTTSTTSPVTLIVNDSSTTSQTPSATVFVKELSLLAELGFQDEQALLPLLTLHLGQQPERLCLEERQAALRRLISHLLLPPSGV
eukprot:gene8077-8905_t